MKKRYARAKPIKKKKKDEENEIIEWDIVRTVLTIAILAIGLVCMYLIVYL